MNRLGWLKLFPAAASDDDGESELYTYGDLGATTTHLPYDGEPRLAHAVPLKVRTMRLDEAVREGRLRSPNFVKIDVEGHGHRALNGMGQTLRSLRPLLLIGFHCREELEGVMNLLRPLDYTLQLIGSARPVDEPAVGGDYLFIPRPGPRLV
jgi:FkbM family methyltransferase